MDFGAKLIARPGKRVKLADWDSDDALGFSKDKKTKERQAKILARMDDLQYVLYAEKKCALLIVLQAMDAGGKDGTIRHVMSAVNPQGCQVTSFKVPSAEEANHDFLWRIHKAVPDLGDIGIFNRSHYEDVLTVRVHKLVPESVWSSRYEQINRFEKLLVDNRVRILKFFLHISKDEQKKRFQARIDDPTKRWKLSPADFKEREYWNEYQKAYEAVLTECSTEHAPWYIIPANKKWFRNFAVSQIVVETLEGMHLRFPDPVVDIRKLRWK